MVRTIFFKGKETLFKMCMTFSSMKALGFVIRLKTVNCKNCMYKLQQQKTNQKGK